MKIVQNPSLQLTAAADYCAFTAELVVAGSCIQHEETASILHKTFHQITSLNLSTEQTNLESGLLWLCAPGCYNVKINVRIDVDV